MAQLFAPASDTGEVRDLAMERQAALAALYAQLGAWEAQLPTVPIWDSSPYWVGDSARLHDAMAVHPEPR